MDEEVSMWRDPLEELIEDLEGALLAQKPNDHLEEDLPRLADLQAAVQIVLKHPRGEPVDHPLVRKVAEQIARRLERSRSRTAPASPAATRLR
jgi:hypothetical protein